MSTSDAPALRLPSTPSNFAYQAPPVTERTPLSVMSFTPTPFVIFVVFFLPIVVPPLAFPVSAAPDAGTRKHQQPTGHRCRRAQRPMSRMVMHQGVDR